MALQETEAYVLHARRWREQSLLLECFGAGPGRFGLLARGAVGARRGPARAELQPLRRLRLCYVMRGELGTLRDAELLTLHALQADALLAVLYVNELLVRLLPRDEALPRLYARYAALLRALGEGAGAAWLLRGFERDLLDALGYAPRLTHTDEGEAILAGGLYAWAPEQGMRIWQADAPGEPLRGSALLALAGDRMPDAQDQAALRRLLRRMLAEHLGGRALNAWSLAPLAPLARGRPPATD